jgi:hypothetical protein
MAKTNSYTIRDGLGMLEAIIETDGKVMSGKARKACREVIADLSAQLPAEAPPMTDLRRQWIQGCAARHFAEIHPGVAKRASRTTQRAVRA